MTGRSVVCAGFLGASTWLLAVSSGLADEMPAVQGGIGGAALASAIEDHRAPLVLDVRTAEEFDAGHVPGALHLPYDEIASREASLPGDHDAEIVVYCRSGRRAAIAAGALREAGYTDVRMLEGHWLAWEAAGRSVERE